MFTNFRPFIAELVLVTTNIHFYFPSCTLCELALFQLKCWFSSICHHRFRVHASIELKYANFFLPHNVDPKIRLCFMENNIFRLLSSEVKRTGNLRWQRANLKCNAINKNFSEDKRKINVIDFLRPVFHSVVKPSQPQSQHARACGLFSVSLILNKKKYKKKIRREKNFSPFFPLQMPEFRIAPIFGHTRVATHSHAELSSVKVSCFTHSS